MKKEPSKLNSLFNEVKNENNDSEIRPRKESTRRYRQKDVGFFSLDIQSQIREERERQQESYDSKVKSNDDDYYSQGGVAREYSIPPR